MATEFDALTHLSEQELLDHFAKLVVRDRRTTVDLLVAIAEIDERRIWAKHACSSMFTFCMQRFHMSEQVTAKRLWAARTARRYPVVLAMIERGELHLSAIQRLSGHLTEQNHVELLERAKHKSSREVERLIAELAPRPDAPARIRKLPVRGLADIPVDEPAAAGRDRGQEADASAGSASSRLQDAHRAGGSSANRDGTAGASDVRLPWQQRSGPVKPILPLSPRRYKIEVTVDEATHDKLRSLQDLLGRSATGRDPAAILARAIDVLLVETLKRKAAQTAGPRTATDGATDAARNETADAATTDAAATDAATSADAGVAAAASAAVTNGSRRARTIPAAVRREVWRRDCGRCRYVDGRGRRCNETRNVEFHHKVAFARGGRHEADNIELRCPAHNQYQADLDFGRSFMDGKRGVAGGATTFPGECPEALAGVVA